MKVYFLMVGSSTIKIQPNTSLKFPQAKKSYLENIINKFINNKYYEKFVQHLFYGIIIYIPNKYRMGTDNSFY